MYVYMYIYILLDSHLGGVERCEVCPPSGAVESSQAEADRLPLRALKTHANNKHRRIQNRAEEGFRVNRG